MQFRNTFHGEHKYKLIIIGGIILSIVIIAIFYTKHQKCTFRKDIINDEYKKLVEIGDIRGIREKLENQNKYKDQRFINSMYHFVYEDTFRYYPFKYRNDNCSDEVIRKIYKPNEMFIDSNIHDSCTVERMWRIARHLAQYTTCIDTHNKDDVTPLMYSAMGGDELSFQLLLEKGADVEYRSSVGNNVLHYGIMGGNINIIAKILQRDGRMINRINSSGQTPMSYANESLKNEINKILEQGKNEQQITP